MPDSPADESAPMNASPPGSACAGAARVAAAPTMPTDRASGAMARVRMRNMSCPSPTFDLSLPDFGDTAGTDKVHTSRIVIRGVGMQGFAGKVAVVTGAGSGIGQALAIELARSGASVAISDVDMEGLAVTEERIKAIGAPVKADRLDVTEREAFEIYADAVKAHFG